jgi:ribosomal protein L29
MAKTTKKTKENMKGMKPEELLKKLTALQEEIRVMKFKAEGSRTKNVKELAGLKKQIARILTETNRKNK